MTKYLFQTLFALACTVLILFAPGCVSKQMQSDFTAAAESIDKLADRGQTAIDSATTLTDVLTKMGDEVSKIIADQGVLDKWTANAEGDFIEPGAQVGVRIEVNGYVKLLGVTGSIDTAVTGDGTKLPPAFREQLVKQLEQPISDAQRAQILELLGWNRTQVPAPAAPNPTQGNGGAVPNGAAAVPAAPGS